MYGSNHMIRYSEPSIEYRDPLFRSTYPEGCVCWHKGVAQWSNTAQNVADIKNGMFQGANFRSQLSVSDKGSALSLKPAAWLPTQSWSGTRRSQMGALVGTNVQQAQQLRWYHSSAALGTQCISHMKFWARWHWPCFATSLEWPVFRYITSTVNSCLRPDGDKTLTCVYIWSKGLLSKQVCS